MLRAGESLALAAAGDGGGDFDGGDMRDVDHGGWAAARDAANPGGAGFLDIAFDQGAGIDEVGAVATSAPLADDGFRQRLALDGDRLIVGVVVVDVEGGVGQAGDEAAAINR